MDAQQELHFQRLREALEQIQEFRGTNALDTKFTTWKKRTYRELRALCGFENDYTVGFQRIRFWEERVGPVNWVARDEELYQAGLDEAEQVLRDALDEFSVAPETFPSRADEGTTAGAERPDVNVQLIVQQQQSVAQIQAVSYARVIESIPSLGLEPGVADAARQLAKEFREEAEGERRWDRIGSIVGRLGKLGKGIFDNVAAPLLVELIKRQTGL